MGILGTIRGLFGRSVENPAVPLSAVDVDWESYGWTTGSNPSGVAVNAETALTYSAVYACVRIISETLGSMQLNVVRELPPADPVPLFDHPIQTLYDDPNPTVSGQVFRESRIVDQLTAGAMFSEIIRNDDGLPIELWGLAAAKTRAVLKNRALWYEVSDENGHQRILHPADVLHVPLLPAPGSVRGRAPSEAGATAIGLGLAVERAVARLFGKGLPGTLEAPGKLDDDRYADLKKRWRVTRATADPTTVLDGGLKWTLEQVREWEHTRSFQVLEVARFYGVPPIMIGEAEKGAPKSSTEEQERDFARHTLRPIAKRIEAEDARKLFIGEPRGHQVRHHFRELLRADVKTMWDTYSKGRTFGIYSVNEIRRELGLAGIGPAGDVHHSPVNLAELGRRFLDQTIGKIGDAFCVEERHALLAASEDGDDAVGERCDRFYADHQGRLAFRLTKGIAMAAAEFGLDPDRDAVANYANDLAEDHCRRAKTVVERSVTDWIAAGRFEFEPGEAFKVLTSKLGLTDETE